jgi:hypothetical protein
VVAFCVYWLALVIAWPGILSWSGTGSWLALAAVAGAIFGFLGLCVASLSVVVSLLGLGLFLWAMLGLVESGLMKTFLNGSHPAMAIGVLCAATGAAVLAIVRILCLTEEDAAYHRKLQLDTWTVQPRVTGEVNRAWAEAKRTGLFGWPGSRARIVIPTTHALWDCSRRWRCLTAGSLPVLGIGAVIWILCTWLPVLQAPDSNSGAVVPMFLIMSMMPALVVSQMWFRQWRFLETESLRPIDRGRFLSEIGMALAINVAQCWGVFAAAVVVRATVLNRFHFDSAALAEALCASALVQVFLCGVIVWLMRYRSPGMTIGVGGSLAVLVTIPTVILACPKGIYEPARLADYGVAALVVSGVLALLGLLIARDARRRWLVTELG